jgi:hypothetical protein
MSDFRRPPSVAPATLSVVLPQCAVWQTGPAGPAEVCPFWRRPPCATASVPPPRRVAACPSQIVPASRPPAATPEHAIGDGYAAEPAAEAVAFA